MRSQGKGAPDAADCGLVDAGGLCHRGRRPMRGSGRLALQRAYDDLFNLGIAQLAGLSGTRLIEQAVQSTLSKPAPPFTDCLNTRMRLCRDGRGAQPLSGTQNNARPHRKMPGQLSFSASSSASYCAAPRSVPTPAIDVLVSRLMTWLMSG